MKRLILLVAACGSQATQPTPPTPLAPPAPVDRPVPPSVVTYPTPTRPKIEAPHGAVIKLIGVTSDGTAALTADELGEIRLWPALDGTREPCVVDLPVPVELAIATRPEGFSIAAIDGARTLTIQLVDRDGRTLKRTAIAAESGVAGIAMATRGVVAWLDDQSVSVFAFDGAKQLGRIGTEPGERIIDASVAGAHALVKLDARGHALARVLDLEALTWSKPAELGGAVEGAIAISPSGTRIAAVVKTEPGTEKLRVFEGSRLVSESPMVFAVGFVDEHTLAAGIGNGIAFRRDPDVTFEAPQSMGATNLLFATGAGVAVAAVGGELIVARPTETRYLGYALEAPQLAAVGPDHHLVVGAGHELAQLDDHLLAIPNAPVPKFPDAASVVALAWLSGRDYAADVVSPDGATSVVIVSDDREPVELQRSRTVQPIRYQPTTQLLTESFGPFPTIHRWLPDQRRTEVVATIARSKRFEQVELVPTETGIVKVTQTSTTRIAWADRAGEHEVGAQAITAFITADRAGHVYAWTESKSEALALSVLAPDKTIATLPHDGVVTLWPDPRGDRVLELSTIGVALYRCDGTVLWKLGLFGAMSAVWTDDDNLTLVTTTGLVRLSAATGSVTVSRCGWKFGLSATPHAQGAQAAPICTQLR